MTKRKRTKWQTTIYKTLHRQLSIDLHEPQLTTEWIQLLRIGKQFLLHKWHSSCCSNDNDAIKQNIVYHHKS